MRGGVEGNELLTARTAAVLLVLLALEGGTLVAIHTFLLPHIFLGFLLIPPVALKFASTGWRMLGYYRGRDAYVRRGPPHALARLVVAPVVVLSTIALFASGIAVIVAGGRGFLLTLHKASFVVWFGAMSAHVLWHVWKLPWLVRDHLPGRGPRILAVGASLVAGLALAAATIPAADHWQDRATGLVRIDAS